MESRRLLPLLSLGLVVATLSASSAEAQRGAIIVCNDGTRVVSNNARDCNRHRGVDGRATESARRHEADRVAGAGRGNGRRDDRWDDRRDDRDRDPRRDARDGRDARDARDANGRYDDRYGYGTGNGRNQVYEWSGYVDKEIQIQLRGDRAVVQPIGAGDQRSGRGRVMGGLPRREGTLVIQRLEGRGDVDVIAQPSSRNNYTATLRIRDERGGSDNYRIVAYWQPSGDDRYGYDNDRRWYSGN
jgi:hypothetical protein